jgi:hypothetical protein
MVWYGDMTRKSKEQKKEGFENSRYNTRTVSTVAKLLARELYIITLRAPYSLGFAIWVGVCFVSRFQNVIKHAWRGSQGSRQAQGQIHNVHTCIPTRYTLTLPACARPRTDIQYTKPIEKDHNNNAYYILFIDPVVSEPKRY